MTLAQSLKPVLSRIRSIPGSLGLRPHTVEILNKSWDGEHTGAGEQDTQVIPIVEANGQPPKIRWLTDEQLALGDLAAGTVEIGPVTSAFVGGGLDINDLNASALARGDVLQLRIKGPKHQDGAVYHVTRVTAHHAMHLTIQAKPSGPS